MVGYVGEGFKKHEFRHQFAKWIFSAYGVVDRMDTCIVVVEISLEGIVVEPVFDFHHPAEVSDIVGVAHCDAVFRIGEIG